MRSLSGLVLLVLIVQVTGSLPVFGQVADGDILVLVNDGWMGYVLRVNPITGAPTTLVPRVQGWSPQWLRMAPDNQRLIADYFSPSPSMAALVSITVGGPFMPFVAVQNSILANFALDHDDRWIVVGAFQGGSGTLAVEEASRTVTTLFQTPLGKDALGGLCIDRDPGASPYVITGFNTTPSLTTNVLRADRSGLISTVYHAPWGATAIALEPATGDYLLCSSAGASGIHRLQKGGGITTLSTAVAAPSALRFDADGSYWVTGYMSGQILAKLDGSGRILRVLPLPSIPISSAYICLELYGSRKLVCNGLGTPGTTVKIRLQSGRAGDGNRTYALACSFARRPGVKFGNGERLDLSVTDPLFLLTATNQLPGVFQSFRGTTNSAGSAMAQVVLPRSLPASSGITVFVAGIVYDSTGVRTATNTHWFVLN